MTSASSFQYVLTRLPTHQEATSTAEQGVWRRAGETGGFTCHETFKLGSSKVESPSLNCRNIVLAPGQTVEHMSTPSSMYLPTKPLNPRGG